MVWLVPKQDRLGFPGAFGRAHRDGSGKGGGSGMLAQARDRRPVPASPDEAARLFPRLRTLSGALGAAGPCGTTATGHWV